MYSPHRMATNPSMPLQTLCDDATGGKGLRTITNESTGADLIAMFEGRRNALAYGNFPPTIICRLTADH